MGPAARRTTFLALTAIAVAACGDDAPPPVAQPPVAAPDTAKTERAATPATPRSAEAARAVARLLDTRLNEDSDDDTRERARRDLLASGADAIAALVAALESDDDARRDAARELLASAGADAVAPLGALLRDGCRREAASAALELLHDLAPLWTCTDLAPGIASAALDAADEDPELRGRAVEVLRDAGDACNALAPRLAALLQGRDATDWLDEFDDEPATAARVFRPLARDLVALLATDEDDGRWSHASTLLLAMRSPPAGAIDDILRIAADGQSSERNLAVRIAAAWSMEDPRCAATALRLLGDGDWREPVLEGWTHAPRVSDEIALAALRFADDADDDVNDPAFWIARAALGEESRTTDVARILAAAAPADAARLCRVIGSFDNTQRDALVPALVATLASGDADVRVAAFRALESADWDTHPQVVEAALRLLDASDPRVRAYAAFFATFADDPPLPRLRDVALPLVRSLDDPGALVAAMRALWDADESAARAEAVRLLGHSDSSVQWWARSALEDGPAGVAADTASLDLLMTDLRNDNDQVRVIRLLLRLDGGLARLTTYLDERLARPDRDLVLRTLGWLMDTGEAARALARSIERLRRREGFAGMAEVALACLEPDDAATLRRLEALLPSLKSDERELADTRLASIGPAGATLCVRAGASARHLYEHGASWVERQPEAVRAAVQELAASGDVADRERAADWAYSLAPADATPLLRNLLADADGRVRVVAFESATAQQERDAAAAEALAPQIAAFVVDSDSWTVPEAALFLARCTRLPGSARTSLAAVLACEEIDARCAAATALLAHRLDTGASIDVLVTASRDAESIDDDVQRACTAALVALGRDASPMAPALPRLLGREASSLDARLGWIGVCRAIGPAARPAVPVLRHLLVSGAGMQSYGEPGPVPEQRRAVIDALAAIGRAAAPAVPALREVARDPRFRDAANDAVRRIESAAE